MKVLKLLVYGNLLVSFSAGLLAFSCAHFLNSFSPTGIGLTVFFATLFLYNFQRLIRIKEIKNKNSARHIWIEKHSLLVVLLTFLGFFGAIIVYFTFLGLHHDFIFLLVCFVIGVIYAAKLFPFIPALRDIPAIKIYIIALQWTFISVVWIYIRVSETVDFPINLVLSVFFFILACTVPFDIRDLVYDSPSKKTIPQLLGIKGAKIVALLFLFFSLIAFYFTFPNTNFLWLFICYFGLIVLILNSNSKQPEMYYSGIIDGWIIVYAAIIYTPSLSANL